MGSVAKIDKPVLIAGGGPVGMTLALELARHGVGALVIERNEGTTRHPKMDLTNGRSMELYKRLGVVERLRAVGVPEENPFDIYWATSPTGDVLHLFHYPSAAEARRQMDAANDGTGTSEPGMRISQIILEPVLKEAIEKNPLIETRFGWAFESLTQDSDGVSAVIRNAKGEEQTVRGLWLAGCDGGGSRVRRQLGIELEGQQSVARIYMIHFKSKDRETLNPWGPAWHLQTGKGNLVAQDDVDTWTMHCPLPPGIDEEKVDPADLVRDFVGRDFDFKILIANPWSPHLVIADRYRDGRVFLAGDSAHQVIPTGGYGMNSGVGDAVDLGWKLAAVVNGWGGDGLLDSYEWERKRIAIQNRTASGSHFDVRVKIAELFAAAQADGDLEAADAAGEARRRRLGEGIAALGNAENECWGIEFGYRYHGSPIVAEESAPPPAFDPLVCLPTTYPGARLPHFKLQDGRALHDVLGPEFTLLAIGEASPNGFELTAARIGVPLKVVRLEEEPVLRRLERSLLLVRPDQHIAWRGDAPPADIGAILSRAAGRS